jgi:hypothetical protein
MNQQRLDRRPGDRTLGSCPVRGMNMRLSDHGLPGQEHESQDAEQAGQHGSAAVML